MERYTKPPLTYQQQVELLKSRGLQFADEARAKGILPISAIIG